MNVIEAMHGMSVIEAMRSAVADVSHERQGKPRRRKGRSVVDGVLPQATFDRLASLVAAYSEHRKTWTVTFMNRVLRVNRAAGCADVALDTYINNGPVALAYVNLLGEIRIASEVRAALVGRSLTADQEFATLSQLYCFLTRMSPDTCNQENAADFADYLLQCVVI